MFAAILITLTVIIGSFSYWCFEQKRKFQCLNHLPGPKGYPIIGNALEFGFKPTDIYKALANFPKQYGVISRMWIGPNKCYLVVSDAEFLEFLLSSPVHVFKSSDYEFFRPWLSNGLLLSNGSYWHKRRKVISPAFHFKILEEFILTFMNNADILVKRLSKKVGKDVFDLYPYITDFTLDNICETAMGTSVQAQQRSDNEYVKAVRELTQIICVRMFSFWKVNEFLYKFSNDYKQQNKCLNIVHGFSRTVIENRRAQLTANAECNNKDDTDEFGVKRKVAFLDVLLKATIDGVPLSNEDIREEVDTFMFEGHDTTSSALVFTCYELSRNPRVQNKVIDEFHELFGNDKNRQLTLTDLNNMKYLEVVIKETLRFHTTVPFVSRELREDADFNDIHLPKGLQIIILMVGLHRRADLFKDADTFYPERFLENSDHSKTPFAYIPFSAGPRNCIGQKFAMNEMKVALYRILTNFELLPSDRTFDIIPAAELILNSANGMHLSLKNRN